LTTHKPTNPTKGPAGLRCIIHIERTMRHLGPRFIHKKLLYRTHTPTPKKGQPRVCPRCSRPLCSSQTTTPSTTPTTTTPHKSGTDTVMECRPQEQKKHQKCPPALLQKGPVASGPNSAPNTTHTDHAPDTFPTTPQKESPY